jgi:ubiquinone/menaquinone biosynthesis C-methylase UbiE
MDLVNKSYQSHQNWFQKHDKEELLSILRDNCLNRDNSTSHKPLFPILNPNDTWLTVGDCYGTDAIWLSPYCKEVMAVDILTAALELAQQEGFIKMYSGQNAEKMTFEDNSFDIVYCRETFHHFPRPYIAVYEMLRCAKKAVIIDEAMDIYLRMPFLTFVCNILDTRKNPKRSYKFWKHRFSFEAVGNYIYKTSPREFEKVAMGIGLSAIAFYHYNFIKEGTNFQEKMKYAFVEAISALKIIPYRRFASILFKELPDNETKKALCKYGYYYYELPKNPYLI